MRPACSHVALAPVFLLLLAACGGGGGGGGSTGFAGKPGPARSDGGSMSDFGHAVACYPDGSFVVTGQFEGSATFGAGSPGATTLSALPGSCVFIARYDASFNLMWVRQTQGPNGGHSGKGVAVAPDGSILVVGHFLSVAQFDGGSANAQTLLAAGGSSDQEGFVARYTAGGDLVWVYGIGGVANQGAVDVAVASDGSAYVTGSMAGSTTFDAGGNTQKTLPPFGGEDAFVARYAADGSLVFATLAGGTTMDRPTSIDIVPGGGCVIAGLFEGSAVFGFFEQNATILASAGGTDAFLAGYADDGSLIWAKRAGGPLHDAAGAVMAYGNGAFAATGYFGGTAVFGPGESAQASMTASGALDLWIAVLTSVGDLAWVRGAGGDDTLGGTAIGRGPGGSLIVAGYLRGGATFGSSEPNETVLGTNPGQPDAFVARYEANGSLAWADNVGSQVEDAAWGLATLPSGHALIVGSFRGTAVFGKGGLNQTDLVSAGDDDIFIARYNANGELD